MHVCLSLSCYVMTWLRFSDVIKVSALCASLDKIVFASNAHSVVPIFFNSACLLCRGFHQLKDTGVSLNPKP